MKKLILILICALSLVQCAPTPAVIHFGDYVIIDTLDVHMNNLSINNTVKAYDVIVRIDSMYFSAYVGQNGRRSRYILKRKLDHIRQK